MVGRLTLTWSNKDQALVSDDNGGYEWVDPSNVRAAEVRLFDEVASVGEVSGGADDNLLIHGDSLDALRCLTQTPEYKAEYEGKVKLVYIDPPFNTKQAFEHYNDNLEHSVWLSMMRERLEMIEKLLSPDGSVWVHLDDAEMAYAKVLLDEVFGRKSFIATIVWQKRYSRENRVAIGAVQDYILVYAPRGRDWRDVRNRIYRAGAKEYRNPNNDPRGPWRLIPITAQGFRANQMYTITAPNGKEHRPPKGRCWGMVEEKYLELVAAGKIGFGADGNAQPGLLRYFDEDEGLVPWTWWTYDEVGHTDESKKEILELFPEQENPFDTPKPERFMARIIEIATNPGEIVVDVFAGSGTTAAVSHKLGRRWVTVERDTDVLSKFTRPRLKKVVSGDDQGGVLSTTILEADNELPKGVTPEDAKRFGSLLSKFAKALDQPFDDEDQVDSEGTDQLDFEVESDQTEVFVDPDVTKTVKRLKALAKTTSVKSSDWSGGGGFRELKVRDAVFESAEIAGFSTIVVAPDTDDDTFARAVAAKLGYSLEPGEAPFVGRKNKARLAVIRGTVDSPEIEGLLGGINDDETLLIAATAVTPEARATLREHSKGSRVLQVPIALFPSGGVIQ